MKLQVIERVDELIAALAAFEDKCGRALELLVHGDGTCTLMGSDAHLCFDDVVGRYANFAELMEALQ